MSSLIQKGVCGFWVSNGIRDEILKYVCERLSRLGFADGAARAAEFKLRLGQGMGFELVAVQLQLNVPVEFSTLLEIDLNLASEVWPDSNVRQTMSHALRCTRLLSLDGMEAPGAYFPELNNVRIEDENE